MSLFWLEKAILKRMANEDRYLEKKVSFLCLIGVTSSRHLSREASTGVGSQMTRPMTLRVTNVTPNMCGLIYKVNYFEVLRMKTLYSIIWFEEILKK